MVESNVKPSVSLLKNIELLTSFSDVELQRLLQKGSTESVEAHTNIIIEGEMSWGLYIVLEGQVGIYKTNKLTSTTYDIAQLGSGGVFGEMSLIDDNPRSATVKALTNCHLFFISKEAFEGLLNQTGDLRDRFYMSCVKQLVIRLRELDDNYVISQYQLWQKALRGEGE